MAEKYSRGSIVPFVAVAIVLVIALAGVLYTVRHRSDAAKIASQPSTQVTPQLPVEQSPSKPDTSPNQSGTNTDTAQDQPKDNSKGNSASSTSLPQTGPRDIMSFAVITILGYVTVSYIQSRRQLERLF